MTFLPCDFRCETTVTAVDDRRLPCVRASDSDDLIDAGVVAEILGLKHRNSVSTYRSRYPDFPRGTPCPSGGRGLVWRRADVVAWHRAFVGPADADASTTSPRLEELVNATVRLLLAAPGTDIGIRQIAAEAGMAHSDLYRYAESKEQLLDLALEKVTSDFHIHMPDTLDEFELAVPDIVAAVLARRPAVRLLVEAIVADPDLPVRTPLPATTVIPHVQALRARESIESPVDPAMVAACAASMLLGFTLLEGRYRQAMSLPDDPVAQLAQVVRAVLRA